MALIHERLIISMTFNLTGKSNAASFIVAYTSIDTTKSREELDMFWAELDSILNRVNDKYHLLVSVDANARTGVRTDEDTYKIVGTFGGDSQADNSSSTSSLYFAGASMLALVNTFFPAPKESASRAFNVVTNHLADGKRVDYNITRQDHRRPVRNVTVHPQPPNIKFTSVRPRGDFAHHRPS